MRETIGDRVRAARRSLHLSQARFAENLGVSQATISRWENGEDMPSDDNLRAISDLTNIPVARLRYGSEYDTRVVVVGYIGAGEVVLAIDDHAIGAGLETVDRPHGVLEKDIVALRIRGDSMRPLKDGWLVYYKRDFHGVVDDFIGKLCVVQVAGGPVLLKELRKGYVPATFNLHSWSAGVDPLDNQVIEWAAPVVAITPP